MQQVRYAGLTAALAATGALVDIKMLTHAKAQRLERQLKAKAAPAATQEDSEEMGHEDTDENEEGNQDNTAGPSSGNARRRGGGKAKNASRSSKAAKSPQKPKDDAATKALRTELKRVTSAISALDARVEALFESFVVRCCRDTCAAARRDVVVALARWSAADGANFLVDTRLKYLAWGMSDKVRPAWPFTCLSHEFCYCI